MIVAAFALPMEIRPALKRAHFNTGRVAGYKVYRGGIGGTDAVLLVSGVGAEKAYGAARDMIAALNPELYISAGLCGSISPDAVPGEVHVADGILSFVNDNMEQTFGPDDGLLASPGALAGLKHTRLICSDRVLVSSAEKHLLHERHPDAAIVDMESAGAARAAREAGIPFMAVKAVSDGHEENLPVDFNRFTEDDGGIDVAGLIFHVLTHPSTIGPLVKLSRNSKAAAENLAARLYELLPRISTMSGH